jgi:hypothetical protein
MNLIYYYFTAGERHVGRQVAGEGMNGSEPEIVILFHNYVSNWTYLNYVTIISHYALDRTNLEEVDNVGLDNVGVN